jgi:hypothetical protein
MSIKKSIDAKSLNSILGDLISMQIQLPSDIKVKSMFFIFYLC